MNYGFIVPEIRTEKDGTDYVLGSSFLSTPVINESGVWPAPDREPQNVRGVETNACTVYGTLSAIESQLLKRSKKVNYSDRYVANVALQEGVLDPNVGANPHNTIEVIRKISGNVDEAKAPWNDAYYSLNPDLFKEEGRKWYDSWKLTHDWVFTSGTPEEKREKLKEALTKGTVCVSVRAWKQNDGLYVKERGEQDNHWCLLLAAHDDHYEIFDSYDSYIKKLDPLYDFGFAKVIYLAPVTAPFTRNLEYGVEDPEVARLQTALVSLGFNIVNATTEYFGVQTRYALGLFQMKNGILGDYGYHFGPRTRYALNKALNPDSLFGGSMGTFISALFSAS